jgi:hypothetical protein
MRQKFFIRRLCDTKRKGGILKNERKTVGCTSQMSISLLRYFFAVYHSKFSFDFKIILTCKSFLLKNEPWCIKLSNEAQRKLDRA